MQLLYRDVDGDTHGGCWWSLLKYAKPVGLQVTTEGHSLQLKVPK
jgi:hypothetical protein